MPRISESQRAPLTWLPAWGATCAMWPVRFLDTLPPKQYWQVARKIIMLIADPRPADAERLTGYEYSRVTVREYRGIFDVSEGVLRVVAIGKRNDDEVYRRLS